MKYVTPAYYRASGEAIPIAGVTDLTLARFIARAESAIDQFCHLDSLAPDTVSDEVRPWNPESRRYYYNRSPVPVSAITSFLIQISTDAQTGNDLAANVNPNDIVINNGEGWFEVVSMTALTLGLTPVLLNLGLSVTLARVGYTCGWTFTEGGETLYSSDNLTYAGSRCLWDPAVPAVVQKNGVTVASGISIDYRNGSITFNAANLVSDVVTVAYSYHIPDAVRAAAVDLTSALLAERALQAVGLAGIQGARAGRYYQAARPQGQSGFVFPDEIKQRLNPFRHISLGAS